MEQLVRLYLQQNSLNGTIPQSIGQSYKLIFILSTSLNLCSYSLGQTLVALQAVRLYDNQLTGPVLDIGKAYR